MTIGSSYLTKRTLSVCPETFQRENWHFRVVSKPRSRRGSLKMASAPAQKSNDFKVRFPDRHLVLQAVARAQQAVENDHSRTDDAEPHGRNGGRIAEIEGVPVERALVDVGRHGLGRPERSAPRHDPDQVKNLHFADEGQDV